MLDPEGISPSEPSLLDSLRRAEEVGGVVSLLKLSRTCSPILKALSIDGSPLVSVSCSWPHHCENSYTTENVQVTLEKHGLSLGLRLFTCNPLQFFRLNLGS